MKRIFKKILLSIVIIFSLFFLIPNVHAQDLDRINNYIIEVNPNMKDGSLDIRIEIDWTVLDSKSEGPLEWVKIGAPNYHVENIEAHTSNIKKIKYYSDNGSFIRIDFNNKYYQGEKVHFEFSFNQSYMYFISDDLIYYDYNPGYFPETLVDNCILKWNNKNVKRNNSSKENVNYYEENGYDVYESRLGYNEYISVNYTYDKSSFETIDSEKAYTNEYDKYPWLLPLLFISGVVLFILFVYFVDRVSKDPYQTDRGFYMPSNWYYWYHFRRYRYRPYTGVSKEGKRYLPPKSVNGGGFSGGHSGGCACACACACAGGGRAGCSFKDFYHTNIKTKDLEKTINK